MGQVTKKTACQYTEIYTENCETFCKPVIPLFHFVAVDQHGNDNDDDGNSNDGGCDCSDYNVSDNKHNILQKYTGIKINKMSYVLSNTVSVQSFCNRPY